ncbi:MAG: cupin [Bacteroidales bacterium]|nr:cupin [Bacteroidales bacterium]
MPKLINKPTIIEAAGTPPKLIQEFIGRVNSENQEISIARMTSPQGWSEPGQTPEFNEFTVVLKGTLRVETEKEVIYVKEGQAIQTLPGEWIRYSTPYENGAEYIAVCLPAFSPEIVKRDT